MIRRLLQIVGGLVVLLVIAAGAVYAMSNRRIARTYDVAPSTLSIPSDSASIARGEHLTRALAKCVDCHGENLGGALVVDAGPVMKILAPNLTRGAGGLGAVRSDAELVRAVRYGITPEGKSLLFMPSDEYQYLSDADLAEILAYVRSVPPVDSAFPLSSIGPLGRALLLKGDLPLLVAERIDQTRTTAFSPLPSDTVAYGQYLARISGCIGCHGPGLSGGQVPGTPPEFPPATNISPSGIGHYNEGDFFRALREGKRPNGTELNPFMPWKATSQMTDDEIRAVFVYLRTVPPKDYGAR